MPLPIFYGYSNVGGGGGVVFPKFPFSSVTYRERQDHGHTTFDGLWSTNIIILTWQNSELLTFY